MKYVADKNSNASDMILFDPVSDGNLLRICHVWGTHSIYSWGIGQGLTTQNETCKQNNSLLCLIPFTLKA